MLRPSWIRVVVLALVFVGLSTPVAALERVAESVYRLDPERLDDLLDLSKQPDLLVLIIDDKSKKKMISDAHIRLTREWIRNGGTLWVVESGLENPLVEQLVSFRVERFDYKKAATGDRGGELVVKGASPRLVIHDHPLTANVTQLYLYPRYKFDGTRDVMPMVEMTDTKGNHGLVLLTLEIGRGMVVLDGTARKKRLPFFGRIPDFDEDHPNAVKQGSEWNDYDWERILENTLAVSRAAMTMGS